MSDSEIEMGFGTLQYISGIEIANVAAGIKYLDRNDLCVFHICPGASISGVFTQNAFCAAPVNVAKAHLALRNNQHSSYLLINAGNANAGTGALGLANAKQSCQMLVDQLLKKEGDKSLKPLSAQQVLPFSTGVIGEHLPMEKIAQALALVEFSEVEFSDAQGSSGEQTIHSQGIEQWKAASNSILTTDTVTKTSSYIVSLSNGKRVSLTGIAKGSGMIKPDMATMLAYIACDADIEQNLLDEMLREANEQSFNCITVDGDTSTNDSCMLIATGKRGEGAGIVKGSEDHRVFQNQLNVLFRDLAQAVVRDGEGATKFIEIIVRGGKNKNECKEVAYTIAHSPLVKTAFFASDANWGRILAALGRAPIEALDLTKVNIVLGGQALIEHGEISQSYSEAHGQQVMAQKDITLVVELNRGDVQSTIWTCDFSYDYIKN